MREQTNSCYDAALEYLENGWSVIPVDSKTKKPLIPWKEFQNRLPTKPEIRAWFKKWPNANVAIVTGSVSGNIYVVDCDGYEGIQWARENLPDSEAEVISGREGGRHLYFYAPEGVIVKNKTKIVHQIDIRGEGGYIIAPPSIHANGKNYTWVLPGNVGEER